MLHFLACSNGLGHLNRCVSLALVVKQETNFRIKIYCSKTGYDTLNLKRKFQESEIHIVKDMKYLQEYGFDQEYWRSLLDQKENKNDIFISDNLISFLKIKPQCILIANFFWHDVDIKPLYQNNINWKLLLQSTRPNVIGHHFFSMPVVKRENFYPYGYSNELRYRNTKKNQHLLISGGGSGRAIEKFKEKKSEILKIARKYNKIYLDKYLLSVFSNDLTNFEIADFTEQMFDSIKYSISRPGLGTLKELYLRKIPYMPIFESANYEMIHLEKLSNEIGLACNHDDIHLFSSSKLKEMLLVERQNKSLFQALMDVLQDRQYL